MSAAIEISNLRKTFDGGQNYILDGMSLEIPKGKITMLIGFSGTGKSVLMKHILGLIKPTSGSIKVFGKEMQNMSESELKSYKTQMGVLFQHAALFDDMTVIENVLFPLNEHRRDLSKEQRMGIARHKLELSGMGEKHFHKLPAEISGGMRKRVGLARALALDPKILMYDEPTTGLDPILTEMVDDLILSTHKQQDDATSLVISHDLTAAFRLGDYIVMLDKGKVLMSGTQEDFLNTDNEFIQRFVSKGMKRS